MENSFRKSISVNIDKKRGFVDLTLRVNENKADVYRIPISDMASVLNEFREGMRDPGSEFMIETSIREDREKDNL